MIQLTNFKGATFTINAMYIEKIESLPDTTITLVNGRKYFVQESETDVIQLSTAFYQAIGFKSWHMQAGEDDGR